MDGQSITSLKAESNLRTVFITGSSSGIGKQTTIAFAEAGWNVAATMRSPNNQIFENYPNVKVYQLDVTDDASISAALNTALKDFGSIDVVVNNAGYAVDGVFEAMSDEVILKQFQTNVFGLMRLTRQSIKIMRQQEGGIIIQVASMGGRLTFPLYSIYHATKWAVEGFSESLGYELQQFNIKVKIIEPGAIKTDFYGSSRQFISPERDSGYDIFTEKVEKVSQSAGLNGEDPAKVAKTIFTAATDNKNKVRYVVGKPAPILLLLRRLLSDRMFMFLIKKNYKI
ncbi:MAG: oxidoreductase [Candidatus Saccharimonadales bacterium]